MLEIKKSCNSEVIVVKHLNDLDIWTYITPASIYGHNISLWYLVDNQVCVACHHEGTVNILNPHCIL